MGSLIFIAAVGSRMGALKAAVKIRLPAAPFSRIAKE